MSCGAARCWDGHCPCSCPVSCAGPSQLGWGCPALGSSEEPGKALTLNRGSVRLQTPPGSVRLGRGGAPGFAFVPRFCPWQERSFPSDELITSREGRG